jgi:hypothetical protein
MADFSHIGGAEPSTITFKAATVTQTRNSSVMHQEIISIGDPDSSLGIAEVVNSDPPSTCWGLVVRQIGYSTIVSVAALPANSSQVEVRALPTGVLSTATPAAGSTGVNVYLANQSTTIQVSSVGGVVSVAPNSTAWVKNAGLSVDSSNYLNVNASFTGSTLISVRQLMDSSGGTIPAGDSENNSIRVSVVSGGSTTFQVSSVVGVVSVAPNSTAWVKNAGLSVDSSNYLNVNASFTGSTTVSVAALPAGLLSSAAAAGNSSALLVRVVGGPSSAADFTQIVSSVGGVVSVAPNSTAWVKNAGLSVDSSNYLNVNASFTGSTTVTVAALPANSSLHAVTAFPAGMVSSAAPAANDTGLFVRVIGYSTIVTVAAMPAGSTTVTVAAGNSSVTVSAFASGLISSAASGANSSALLVRVVGHGSSAVDHPVRAVLSSTNTDNPVRAFQGVGNSSGADAWPTLTVDSSNAVVKPGDSANNAIRVNVVSGGSTVVSIGGVSQTIQTAASTSAFGTSTLFAINSTVTGQKCKVFAYSITTTNAGPTELCFYGGSSMCWPVQLAAVSGAISGVNLAVTPPGFLFETAAGSSMTLRCSGSSVAGWKVGVAFFMAP